MGVEKLVQDALARHDGPVGDLEGAPVDGADDGLGHFLDEQGDNGHGDERPDNEEWLANVGFWGNVAVANGEKGSEAKVKAFKVTQVENVLLGEHEDEGTEAPEDAKGEEGHAQCPVLFPTVGFALDLPHSIEPVPLF